jgi:excinuclease ABC subunit B
MLVFLDARRTVERDAMLRKLVDMQYQRNDYDFHRGTFRVRGDVVEIFPRTRRRRRSASSCSATRSRAISEIDPLRGRCCAARARRASIRRATTCRRDVIEGAPSRSAPS